MNILKEYTLDYVLKNRRSSLAIMTAILIASTLLSTLCIFLYNIWFDSIKGVVRVDGNWHGELSGVTAGNKLKYVTAHPNVEKVMLQGEWYTLKAGTVTGKRPYLIVRDADSEYWEEMSERRGIIEGRIPADKSEIAISKQYFEDNPDIKIGSILSLPVGVRISGYEKLEPAAVKRQNETFSVLHTENFKIVGMLDMSTSSYIPGYYAMGYLERSSIKPEDGLTVYVNFYNPRKIDEDLPQIASSVGYKPDQHGKYSIKYHHRLLNKYFIYPRLENGQPSINVRGAAEIFGIYILMIVLCIGLFVLIIHNAFELSAKSRVKQLGMLRSIGATPRQIRKSVTFEAMLLSLLPIPSGVLLGYFMCSLLFLKINGIQRITGNISPTSLTINWIIVITAVIFSVITVWLSAYLPAIKTGKILPVDAIRNTGATRLKKARRSGFYNKIFGVSGELAACSLSANRKAYRTSFLSLTVSFLLFATFLNLVSISQATAELYPGSNEKYDFSLFVTDGKQIDPEVMKQIKSLNGLELCSFSNDITGSAWVTASRQSDEITQLGGFGGIAVERSSSKYKNNCKYRLYAKLISLDDDSFAAYCRSLGVKPEEYYDSEHPKAVLINSCLDYVNSTKRNKVHIPITNLRPGDVVKISEKTDNSSIGSYEFNLYTGVVTDKSPRTILLNDNFSLNYVMPLRIYQSIVNNFNVECIPRALNTNISINVNESYKKATGSQLKNILDKWYGSGDYAILSLKDIQLGDAATYKLAKLIIYFVSGLLALIGISNAFSTVTGNLQQRRREFALLRSAGISPDVLNKMFMIEAVFFGIKPILPGVLITLVFTHFFLWLNEIYWHEFLPYMPVLEPVVFIAAMLTFIGFAYLHGVFRIRSENIVDSLKDETI